MFRPETYCTLGARVCYRPRVLLRKRYRDGWRRVGEGLAPKLEAIVECQNMWCQVKRKAGGEMLEEVPVGEEKKT